MNAENSILDALTRNGVLLNVSIRFWRAHKKLQAADLGLDPSDVTDRLISLGHKKLLPKEDLAGFALIESRAHAMVEAATFPFLGGIARFLPNAKLPEVTARLASLEREFADELDRFKLRYGSLRSEAIHEWRQAAYKLQSDAETIVANVASGFPSVDDLDRYFGFQSHLYQVALPEGSSDIELVTAGDQLSVIEARNAAAQEAAGKIRQGTEQFIQDCVATLRQETAKLADEMLVSMTAGKTKVVHQRTLNRLKTFIDEFRKLNFANDHEMEEQLDRVRRELLSRTAEEYRDDTRAQAKLREGLSALRNSARELAREDASEIVANFGQMGVRRFSLAA